MNIDEILFELSSLPKGYISRKIIKGKTYFYLQYLDNNKIISKYIKSNELDNIKKQLERRKQLEKLLKEYKVSNVISKPRILTKRELELTGGLYCLDTLVASFYKGNLTYINESLAPFYIVRTKDISSYLESRCIDLTRVNARVLVKLLGIQNKNETLISLFSHGACISDTYWFKPSGSKLKYKDISFDNDLYSDLALNGKIPQLPSLGSPSPELTNIGSFEKAWKKLDNIWWLYKKGNTDQIFSELFVYYLSILLDVPTARYEYDNGYIRSQNFADKYNFEPMYSLLGDNETYIDVFDVLMNFSKDIAFSYMKLIWLDTICYNVDRHNQNYGLLRDRYDGHYISLAPNFDNNLALLSYNKTLDQEPSKDMLINLFICLVRHNDITKEMYRKIKDIPLSEESINNIYKNIPIKVDEAKITNFIISRYRYLKEIS